MPTPAESRGYSKPKSRHKPEESIYAAAPVRAVLELNGGTASRLGLKAGDRIRHAMFGNPP